METNNAHRPNPLRVTSTDADGVTVVSVTGAIDHASASPLVKALAPGGLGDPPRVIVDLQHVTFMDSTGINILLAAHHHSPPQQAARCA